MNEEKLFTLLEEIRDLQKRVVENQAVAVAKQDKAIANAKSLPKKMFYLFFAFMVALLLFTLFLK